MLGKILLTLAVILGAWLVIRLRLERRGTPAPRPQTRPLLPPALMRALAVGLVAVMVGGSLLWLYLDWESGRGLVNVRVINANTGEVTSFQARRQDIEERQFTTVDGRRVTLAEIERMVLEDAR
jgi:hypothetical protein